MIDMQTALTVEGDMGEEKRLIVNFRYCAKERAITDIEADHRGWDLYGRTYAEQVDEACWQAVRAMKYKRSELINVRGMI